MAESLLPLMPVDDLRGRRVLAVMVLPGLQPEAQALLDWLVPLLVLRQSGAITLVMPVLPVSGEGPGVANEIVAAALRLQGVEEARAVPGIDGGALPYVREAHPGEVLVMENLCQYRAGKALDPALGRSVAGMAEVIVCDDAELADWLRGYAPMVRTRPRPGDLWPVPSLALVAGSDEPAKTRLLSRLSLLVEQVALAGTMALELHQAQSALPAPWIGTPHWRYQLLQWWQAAARSGCPVLIPEDYWLAREGGTVIEALWDLSGQAGREQVPVVTRVRPGMKAVDVGPRSLRRLLKAIQEAKAVLWFGPVGQLGVPAFEVGSEQVARAIAKGRWQGKMTVAAGGATLELIRRHQLGDGFQYRLDDSWDLLNLPAISRRRVA